MEVIALWSVSSNCDECPMCVSAAHVEVSGHSAAVFCGTPESTFALYVSLLQAQCQLHLTALL